MDDISLHGIAVYNPALLSREELKSYFVARTDVLSRILGEIRREQKGSLPQHRLILGLRGMGKSTLLRRIAIAVEDDNDLNKQWLPLTFPEEQYNISSPSDLWKNCLDALSDIIEEQGDNEKAAELDRTIENLPQNNAKAALDLLLKEAGKRKQRLILLIDNIDLILERLKEDHWTLREILQSESQLMIIGASSKAIEASYQYDAAFYDFFKIDELKGLNESEMTATLIRLAKLENAPHVINLIEKDPARIKTMHTLTGGNPRTIVLLYNVLARGLDSDVRSDLESLLDLVTPLYKARLEELPSQAQQLVDGLAVNWDPITARQLSEKLGWNVNTTSSQLNRLQQQAIIEKVKPAEGKRAAFQIGERFFNIWYLMRASRRVRRRLIWLVHFLRMFYNNQDLQDHAKNKLGEILCHLRDVEYNLALAQLFEKGPLRRALEHTALQVLFETETAGEKINALLDLQGDDAQLKPQLERIRMLKESKNKIKQILKNKKVTFDHKIFCFRYFGSPTIPLNVKQQIANAEGQKFSLIKWQKLNDFLEDEWKRWTRNFGRNTEALYKALNDGFMSSVKDQHGAEAAALQYKTPGLASVVLHVLLLNLPNFSKEEVQIAEKIISREIEVTPEEAIPWLNLAELLIFMKRQDEAEKAYRKAIEIDPNFAMTWLKLAELLKSEPNRYDEAEKACRKALEIDPDHTIAWRILAMLTGDYSRKLNDAERAYKKALELDPDSAHIWKDFGFFLHTKLKRYDEAEKAYRKAIDGVSDFDLLHNNIFSLLPKESKLRNKNLKELREALKDNDFFASTWRLLGDLKQFNLKNYDEAEKAYRKSIELDPSSKFTWNNYACLLAKKNNCYDEAEKAYRKAIELDPNYAKSWLGLGHFLQLDSKRYNEAEKAIRKAIELDPNSASAWNDFAFVLHTRLNRYDEAEKAYRKAIELDPDDSNATANLACLLIVNDRHEEAEQLCRKGIEKDPDNSELYNNLAWNLYEQRKNYSEAIKLAKKSLEINSRDNVDGRHTLVSLLVANKQWKEAEPHLYKLISQDNYEFIEIRWPYMMKLFQEIIRAGRAREALEIIDNTPIAQRIRPIRETFAVIAAENPQLLNGVAPEIRTPTIQILREIYPDVLRDFKA